MSGEQVTVQADTREFREALETLGEFLTLAREARVSVMHLLDTPGDLLDVQLHRPSEPGGPARAVFEPTRNLRDLTVLIRAGNAQLRAIRDAALEAP